MMLFRELYFEWRANHRKLWVSMARFSKEDLECLEYDIELLKIEAIKGITDKWIESNCFACDIAVCLMQRYPIEGMMDACNWCPLKSISGECCFDNYSIWRRLTNLHWDLYYEKYPIQRIYDEYVDLCIQMANNW